MLSKAYIDDIYQNIKGDIKKTPLTFSESLSELSGAKLYLKLENQQITGSFKLRGVASKFYELTQDGSEVDHVSAASTGNHASGVLYMAEKHGVKATLFVPETITKTKLDKLQKSDAEVKIAGAQSGDTEFIGADWSKENDVVFIHPYNDPAVAAGQGTIGVELIDQLKVIDYVFVPIGGGGLISGIASYMKAVNPGIQVIGVQPANACEMADSVRLNKVVPPSTLSTISDGTAGGLDPNSITLDICKKNVDDYVLISEEEIAHGLYIMYKHTGMKVEGSAALALAGILKAKERVKHKNCVAIVCGDKYNKELFEKILNQYDA